MILFLKTVVGLRQKVIMNDRTVCDPDVEKRQFHLTSKIEYVFLNLSYVWVLGYLMLCK